MKVKLRLVKNTTKPFFKAPKVIERQLRRGLATAGKKLVRNARTRMRKDTGKSHRSLKSQVTGTGFDLHLAVFSNVVQAYVDAYGLPKGIMPPYGIGSPLYRWVSRRYRNIPMAPRKKFGSAPPATAQQVTKISEGRGMSFVAKINSLKKRDPKRDILRSARAVALAIKRKGIRPTNWNTRTLEANTKQIYRDMQNAINAGVRELKR